MSEDSVWFFRLKTTASGGTSLRDMLDEGGLPRSLLSDEWDMFVVRDGVGELLDEAEGVLCEVKGSRLGGGERGEGKWRGGSRVLLGECADEGLGSECGGDRQREGCEESCERRPSGAVSRVAKSVESASWKMLTRLPPCRQCMTRSDGSSGAQGRTPNRWW